MKRKLNNKRGGKVYVAFIDYKKAFERIGREKLWETLQKLKTSSRMVNMLKSMYSSAQACVRWGASISEFLGCSLGMKQGCLCSPLIFFLSSYVWLLILSDKIVDMAFSCSQDFKKDFCRYSQTMFC